MPDASARRQPLDPLTHAFLSKRRRPLPSSPSTSSPPPEAAKKTTQAALPSPPDGSVRALLALKGSPSRSVDSSTSRESAASDADSHAAPECGRRPLKRKFRKATHTIRKVRYMCRNARHGRVR